MVQKCANPDCDKSFDYYRGGKIYQVDWRDAHQPHQQQSQSLDCECFWLCAHCSPSLQVRVQADGQVGVGPRLDANWSSKPPLAMMMAAGQSRRPFEEPAAPAKIDSGERQKQRRVLVFGADVPTLGRIEQFLQDYGFCAISSRSEAETRSLLATCFFDTFIAVENGEEGSAQRIQALLENAFFPCKYSYRWAAANWASHCRDFIQQMPFAHASEELIFR